MTEQTPSEYEQAAWERLQTFKGRPLSRVGHSIGEKVAEGGSFIAGKADDFLEEHPEARKAAEKAGGVVASGARAVRGGFGKVVSMVPDEAKGWVGEAVASTQKAATRIARAGLSPKQVVKKHRKRGHQVEQLRDVRKLDLEQIDDVGGSAASWYFPAAAALSGVGAGLAISGGQIAVVASAGAAAAPGGAVVAGAIAGDMAFVLGACSRAVGHVGLRYGYDPEDPEEKVFILTAINLGTALSTSAKAAALADISRLTQALVRGKTWELLNKHVVARVASQLAPKFGFRMTKQSLGKVVPVAGIVVGATMNWATLEGVIDAAELAYRRRFLLDKYPQFADDSVVELVAADAANVADEVISVLDAVRGEEASAQLAENAGDDASACKEA